MVGRDATASKYVFYLYHPPFTISRIKQPPPVSERRAVMPMQCQFTFIEWGGFVRNAYFCGGIRGFKKSSFRHEIYPFLRFVMLKPALHTNARASLLQHLNSMNDLG